MSDRFQDREKGFERKYQLDQEQQFRAGARRDKLFGQWAGRKLGYSGGALDTYAAAVVDSNFEKPGDDDMLTKVKTDFSFANVEATDAELTRQLQECAAIAAKEIASESK